jgi:hypothetical protein
VVGYVGELVEDDAGDDYAVLVPERLPALDSGLTLGLDHAADEQEIPVLGPEYELSDDEVQGHIPSARVVGYIEEAPAADEESDYAVLLPDRTPPEPEVPVPAAEQEPSAADAEEEVPSARTVANDQPADDDLQPDPEQESAPESSDDDAAPDEESSRNYRRIYESELRPMERDARVALAHTAENPLLLALCLDPEPQVINAIFQNSLAGLDHARLAAFHHKNPVGLEFIVRRADFLRDTQTQRQLLRNSQMTESLMRRVLGSKPLHAVYKVCVNRDLPERNRVWSRGILRTRFGSSQAEERANLVISTEGRCLTFLVGQTFDARTTSILCGRPYNSVLFIQNLARFPACPPPLLAHLLKQPFVKRHAPLRKLIMQHPNLPSQAKRGL